MAASMKLDEDELDGEEKDDEEKDDDEEEAESEEEEESEEESEESESEASEAETGSESEPEVSLKSRAVNIVFTPTMNPPVSVRRTPPTPPRRRIWSRA